MTDYLNIMCVYLIGYQVFDVIINCYNMSFVTALLYIIFCGIFFIAPMIYVCGVAVGGIK